MEPAKNSTMVTLPLLSVALAERVMFAGAEKLLPLTGDVRLTAGNVAAGVNLRPQISAPMPALLTPPKITVRFARGS